jgi:hypothetical protein
MVVDPKLLIDQGITLKNNLPILNLNYLAESPLNAIYAINELGTDYSKNDKNIYKDLNRNENNLEARFSDSPPVSIYKCTKWLLTYRPRKTNEGMLLKQNQAVNDLVRMLNAQFYTNNGNILFQ